MFTLHPELEAQSVPVLDLGLSTVRLMRQNACPWVILVPRVEAAIEIFDLKPDEQQLLWKETATVAEKMKVEFKAEKMNIAALGNMVPQLHIHVQARRSGDHGWPAAVWVYLTRDEHSKPELASLVSRLSRILA